MTWSRTNKWKKDVCSQKSHIVPAYFTQFRCLPCGLSCTYSNHSLHFSQKTSAYLIAHLQSYITNAQCDLSFAHTEQIWTLDLQSTGTFKGWCCTQVHFHSLQHMWPSISIHPSIHFLYLLSYIFPRNYVATSGKTVRRVLNGLSGFWFPNVPVRKDPMLLYGVSNNIN